MRLFRPYIPLDVRLKVASRQLSLIDISATCLLALMKDSAIKKRLGYALAKLFHGRKHELHHRPALENRQQIKRRGKIIGYIPDANDPDHLVYLENNPENNDHYIETHVRGVGAQRSDTGQRNHTKALERNRGLRKRKPKVKIKSRGFQKPPPGRKWWRGTNRGKAKFGRRQ